MSQSGKKSEKASSRRRRSLYPLQTYVEGIQKGDRILLSQAITLIESTRPEHQQMAQQIIEACLPHAGNSIRIGITGSPGVGKSTFIEALGTYLTEADHKITVLAIDPSSQVSKGSILGDKTRMEQLSINPKAYIRPSPAGTSLGGVARKTRETIILCEAAGFDRIIIETVGVGQSETAVHAMVDCFLLLLLPGAGDELQGIKRGIVEMADVVAVNKADGDRIALAKETSRNYRQALHFFPPKVSGWTPEVALCSALQQQGIEEVWELVKKMIREIKTNGYFEKHRLEQAKYWLHESILDGLKNRFYQDKTVQEKLKQIEKAVLEGKLSSFAGADELLRSFL